MHIFLIRHGESISNTGENYEKEYPTTPCRIKSTRGRLFFKKNTYCGNLCLLRY
jgi:hypothetical protein